MNRKILTISTTIIILSAMAALTLRHVIHDQAISDGSIPPHSYKDFVSWVMSKPFESSGCVSYILGEEMYGSDQPDNLKWAIRGVGRVSITGWSDPKNIIDVNLKQEPAIGRLLFPELTFSDREISVPQITIATPKTTMIYSKYGSYDIQTANQHLTLTFVPG